MKVSESGSWGASRREEDLVSPLLLSAKSLNEFNYSSLGLGVPAPPTVSVILQAEWQSTICMSPPPQNVGVKCQKQPLRWLYKSHQLTRENLPQHLGLPIWEIVPAHVYSAYAVCTCKNNKYNFTPLGVFQSRIRISCSFVHACPVVLFVKRHEINNLLQSMNKKADSKQPCLQKEKRFLLFSGKRSLLLPSTPRVVVVNCT